MADTPQHFVPAEPAPTDVFPLADGETAAIRRAALEDLRSDGLNDDALDEIAGLWRREDEILSEAHALAAAQRPTSPILRARINHERARLDMIEAPIVKTILRQVREECETLLDRAPGRRILSRREVHGSVDDGDGQPIEARVSGMFWWTGVARNVQEVIVEVSGLNEVLVLPIRGPWFSAWIRTAIESAYVEDTRRMQQRRPTLEEAQVYRDVVRRLRLRLEFHRSAEGSPENMRP